MDFAYKTHKGMSIFWFLHYNKLTYPFLLNLDRFTAASPLQKKMHTRVCTLMSLCTTHFIREIRMYFDVTQILEFDHPQIWVVRFEKKYGPCSLARRAVRLEVFLAESGAEDRL